MANNLSKVNNSDLPTLIGQRVIVRFAPNTSERRGIIGAYDSTNHKVRIDEDKTHFWVSTTNTPDHYIFIHNLVS